MSLVREYLNEDGERLSVLAINAGILELSALGLIGEPSASEPVGAELGYIWPDSSVGASERWTVKVQTAEGWVAASSAAQAFMIALNLTRNASWISGGTINPDRLPLSDTLPVVKQSGGIADLTTLEQSQILRGRQVIDEDGNFWAYSGTGSKTDEASYVALGTLAPAIAQVVGLQAELDAKAPVASPALAGNPTAPTQAPGNESTRLATTAFTQEIINRQGQHVSWAAARALSLARAQAGAKFELTDRLGAWGVQPVYVWVTGDMSALVAADEVTEGEGDGGRYFALATNKAGTSGCFVLKDDFGSYELYGAVGNVPFKKQKDLTPTEVGDANDDTPALRAAMRANLPIIMRSFTTYKCVDSALFNRHDGRIIEGAGTGQRFLRPEETIGNSNILLTGAGPKSRQTRYLAPEDDEDTDDPAVSFGLLNKGERVQFRNFNIILYCDYSDTSSTNLGADYDIGLLAGCRANCIFENIRNVGYFRRQGYLFDITDSNSLDQHLDPDGVAFDVPEVNGGADGCYSRNVDSHGALQGRAVLGPLESASGDYYDYRSDTVVAGHGGRGGVGASGSVFEDCYSTSREHHSGYRAGDPASPLNAQTEPLYLIPCCLIHDGRRGSGSQGRVRDVSEIRPRMATMEIARIVLGRTYEGSWVKPHTEPQDWGMVVRDTAGTDISATFADQGVGTYGPVLARTPTGTATGTDLISIEGVNNNPNPSHFPYRRTGDTTGVRADLATNSGTLERIFKGGGCFNGPVQATGYKSYEVNAADNGVVSFVPPDITGKMLIIGKGAGGAFPSVATSGELYYDVGGSRAMVEWINGASINPTTADVTGLDEAPGLTVSAQPNLIKISNRLGDDHVISVTFFG